MTFIVGLNQFSAIANLILDQPLLEKKMKMNLKYGQNDRNLIGENILKRNEGTIYFKYKKAMSTIWFTWFLHLLCVFVKAILSWCPSP